MEGVAHLQACALPAQATRSVFPHCISRAVATDRRRWSTHARRRKRAFEFLIHHEVHDTVNAYLAGQIDQWYFRTDGQGVVFLVNASTPDEAKHILEQFPLGQAGLMGFDYIPLGPLSPLRILNDMVQ